MVSELEDRLTVIPPFHGTANGEFSKSVKEGLGAFPTKQLCCSYLYDQTGSELFEDICHLPEYYPTRCEQEILDTHANAIASLFGSKETVVMELGSGSSTKTRSLLNAFLLRQEQLHYVPIDISPSMLESSSRALLRESPRLRVTAIAREYKDGLLTAKSSMAKLHRDAPKLVLWLGSSIGNFDPPKARQFLAEIAPTMDQHDGLLIGVDLQKDPAILEHAYNDSAQLTAQFNLNLLDRINRELGADFQLDQWRHRAVYNADMGRIEMHLVSQRNQSVFIGDLDWRVSFREGETIHTESSYKYRKEDVSSLASPASGLQLTHQWLDSSGFFSLNLFQRAV